MKQKNALKKLLLICMLIPISLPIFAQVHNYGCRVGSRIFKNLDTTHPGPTNFQYDSDGNGNANGYSNVGNTCDDGSTTPCTLYNYNGTIRDYGILADHSIVYCPLDDGILFLMFASIGIVILQQKRGKILFIIT